MREGVPFICFRIKIGKVTPEFQNQIIPHIQAIHSINSPPGIGIKVWNGSGIWIALIACNSEEHVLLRGVRGTTENSSHTFT